LSDFVLLTCEHGGNRVPAEFSRLFHRHRELLRTHRGYDPGALELARTCARRLKAPLHFATVTRLLVELNRSAGHPSQFSVASSVLSSTERSALLEKHYFPYRQRVEAQIEAAVAKRRRIVHLSFHTFTPQLDGIVRRADIGLLYDPRRQSESAFCGLFKQTLAARCGQLTIRKNYPYLGKSDGFTTALRKKWDNAVYLGIELEVNQRWPQGDRSSWRRLQGQIAVATTEALARFAAR
jgi:predicted N-formylglutamate amidohydrolase